MRALDRLLALLVGLSLAATGALVSWEAVLLGRGDPPALIPRADWDRSLRDLMWDASGLRVAATVALVAGAILVALQVLPRAPRHLEAESTVTRQVWISRASVERWLRHAVLTDPDVVAARTRLSRRWVRVRAELLDSADEQRVEDRLANAVATAGDQLGLSSLPRVRLNLRHGKARVR